MERLRNSMWQKAVDLAVEQVIGLETETRAFGRLLNSLIHALGTRKVSLTRGS
jgi:hypothetical protein